MAFDGVPWMIGGGEAVHNADVGRQLAYSATNGATGVTFPTDLKVVELPTPGGAVRIMPGGGPIKNTYPGASGESYIVRAPSVTDLTVPATGSTGGAVSYVIVKVDDPQFDGVASGPNGPYVFPELVSNIDNLPFPYMVLARIDQPANTATITQAMITDLRKVANPRRQTELRTHALSSTDAETLTNTNAYPNGGQTWPLSAENDWQFFDIPEWATRMKIVMTWAGVMAPPGNAYGWLWVQVGYTVNPDHIVTQGVWYDTPGSSQYSRQVFMVSDEISIPPALRGGQHKIYPRANVDARVVAAERVALTGGSSMTLQVEFMELPD